MLTQRIVAGFILAGLAGAAIASNASAQSGKLRVCQEECAGNPACLRTCGGSAGSKKKLIPPRRPEPKPQPPVVKSWQDEVFARGKDGGGGGSGGGGGR